MSLQFKHFDTRLNQWIYTAKSPSSILTETLENTLLEFYFPNTNFSFGHIDEYSTPKDLKNHPDGDVLLLSSKTRLLYGPSECLEVIEKLCPDRKDRGAYGSIFLGACKNSIHEELNILIVDDSSGENGGILSNELAYSLVGDCYGQISVQLYDKLTQRESQEDKSYRVIQHRFGWKDVDGEDNKYRFGKGTLRPYVLDEIKYANSQNEPKIDLIIPISSFKGTDKDNPDGPSKPQIKPGLYKQQIWLAEKAQSEQGKMAISQLLASFPQGVKDFAEELEAQAKQLTEAQNDPRKLAQFYCENYEKYRGLSVVDEDLDSGTEEEEAKKGTAFMYKLIKADLSGHQQLLEIKKVQQELSRFMQSQWREIAIGRTLTFDRGMIIPSKELKNGEICVPWIKEGEKVLNFRSPFLNSNGMCVSINKHVQDRFGPDDNSLKGIIVVNDEDHKRIQARIKALEAQGIQHNEVDPFETESERQARDFDGDCIGVALASKYPNLLSEAEHRNLPQNAYAPTVKLKKQSFYLEDGTQPPFEEIAIHMSDSISVGVINNHVTTLEALESEIEILKIYGTEAQKSNYLDTISSHYQKLFELEHNKNPKIIREQYKPYMEKVVELATAPRTLETVHQAMDTNRLFYREMIEEGCYQNQIAVDLFKSAKTPQMDLIKENKRYLYRDVNYIKDKKSSQSYLNDGIVPTGYSPVELLISQTNKYFQASQLESRPIVQFQDLFKGVAFTPQQKFAAIAAKHEFDLKYNAAVTMNERRLKTESGPSALIRTAEGRELEITNLLRYQHPGIWKAKTLNIQLEEIPQKYRSATNPHELLAVAQIDGEVGAADGKPIYRKLGTVAQDCVDNYGLKSGMVSRGSELLELKPALTQDQIKILFNQAYTVANDFYASIPESEKLQAAAAAWSISASRQDELEVARKENIDQDLLLKKVSHFMFAAFSGEILSRLEELQFTNLKVVTIDNPANEFRDKKWNPQEEQAIEIRASHHPPGHERYGLRLIFVKDEDGEYKEFAPIEVRAGMLPIGTKAQATMSEGETYTANATIEIPGKPLVEITIKELSKFSYAGVEFKADPVTLKFGTIEIPDQSVKIKLGEKTLGELDSDSVEQLRNHNYLKNGKHLKLKLKSIAERDNRAFVIGSSPNGNLLKINKISFYDFSGQVFNDQEYRELTIKMPPSKTRDAVFLDDKLLGVLFFKKDKEALSKMGLLKPGELTPANAILQSNFSHTFVNVNPQTVEYPQTWTKAFQVFGRTDVNQEQEFMINSSEPILQKIKERPTFLFSTLEQKTPEVLGMAVDNHKTKIVSNWLTSQNMEFYQVPPPEVGPETKKGLTVFHLVSDSIPQKTLESMTRKFGPVINSPAEYNQKLSSLPKRPALLQPVLSSGQEIEQVALPTHHPQTQSSKVGRTEPISVENRPLVTQQSLQAWYTMADKLGRSNEYRQRILEVTASFESGEQLSSKALAAMNQDTQEYRVLNRLTEIAQKISPVLGQWKPDGSVQAQGKIYDISFHPERKDLIISHKDGDVVLDVRSGRVQTNNVSPEVIQNFERAHDKVQQALSQIKSSPEL